MAVAWRAVVAGLVLREAACRAPAPARSHHLLLLLRPTASTTHTQCRDAVFILSDDDPLPLTDIPPCSELDLVTAERESWLGWVGLVGSAWEGTGWSWCAALGWPRCTHPHALNRHLIPLFLTSQSTTPPTPHTHTEMEELLAEGEAEAEAEAEAAEANAGSMDSPAKRQRLAGGEGSNGGRPSRACRCVGCVYRGACVAAPESWDCKACWRRQQTPSLACVLLCCAVCGAETGCGCCRSASG